MSIGPHLHRTCDVSAAFFRQDVAGEMIAPHAQRHFKFEARRVLFGTDDNVIGRPVFETIGGNNAKCIRRRRRTRTGMCRADATQGRATRRRPCRATQNRAPAARCHCRRTCGSYRSFPIAPTRSDFACGQNAARNDDCRPYRSPRHGGAPAPQVRRYRHRASPIAAFQRGHVFRCAEGSAGVRIWVRQARKRARHRTYEEEPPLRNENRPAH